jgi:cytoskeletal protein CcmA (bactofilin family)
MAKKLISVFGGMGQSAQQAQDAVTAAAGDANASAPDAQKNSSRLPVIVLGKTLTFKGELSADEELMLLGRVEGSIAHTSMLTVGIGGTVIGNISAKVLVVKGTVEGDIEASESVIITPTGSVLGDIQAPSVSIIEGAQFNGAVEMPEAAPRRQKSAGGAETDAKPLTGVDVEKLLGDR